jgi:hypothetical protein
MLAPMVIDPRKGDAEDDASSTKSHSLLAIGGKLLGEINLPKLALAWVLMALVPGLLLGVAPLVVTGWVQGASSRFSGLAGVGPALVLIGIAAIGIFGLRPLLREAERNFWSLNSLVVQPGYVLAREGLRHVAERFLPEAAGAGARARLRSICAMAAGLGSALSGGLVMWLVWPVTRWAGSFVDLASPMELVMPALANTALVMSLYFAVASLVWGLADAGMDQPEDMPGFAAPDPSARAWRVAHLSDIHVVGERYGFRIESGRAGPRGNERLRMVLARLAAIHAEKPLDLVLITGDITDAGRSAEWAEFFDALAAHPGLAARLLILPGNHDVNIVDRANPARLELPVSPGKRLRQMRTLSAMAELQGTRVFVVDKGAAIARSPTAPAMGPTLSERLGPHRAQIAAFADSGGMRLSRGLSRLWESVFPMVLPPESEDGLGVLLLNSNAETNFSFTNALGLVAEEDMQAMLAALAAWPDARWLIGLHHHPVEYPQRAEAFSERIGTALINGSRFLQVLRPHAHRIVALHGHRHVDWIGRCGDLRIISAPSPVMEATDNMPTAFYIHHFEAASGGGLSLCAPEKIEIRPEDRDQALSRAGSGSPGPGPAPSSSATQSVAG